MIYDLNVSSLVLKFTDDYIFRDISISFKSGSLTVIKGKNGSGKTCFLQCLCSVIPKHFSAVIEGAVELKDRLLHLDTAKPIYQTPMHFGYLMQEPDKQLCFPFIEEELFFGAENVRRDMSDFNKDYELLVEMFPLLKWENIETNSLSFGQKKVLLFSSLILKNPTVYLLDEPTAGLSNDFRAKFTELIMMLKNKGKIIIIAEHTDYFDAISDEHILLNQVRDGIV